MVSFSVVIPNLNGEQYLKKCLDSLLLSANGHNFEIILVDNGSKDNSIAYFNKLNFTQKKIISNHTNAGFSKAINQGATASQYPWILALNNDITFHKDYFKYIAPNLKSNYAAVAGTVLNYSGDKIESTGLKYFSYGKCINLQNGQPLSTLTHRKPGKVWGLNAACTFYNKDILQKVGGFDEAFFAYEEDVDLAYRLNKQGYQSLQVPLAFCYHLGGGTSNKMGYFRQKQDFKNWIRLILKNYSAKEILVNFPGILIEMGKLFSHLIFKVIKNNV